MSGRESECVSGRECGEWERVWVSGRESVCKLERESVCLCVGENERVCMCGEKDGV